MLLNIRGSVQEGDAVILNRAKDTAWIATTLIAMVMVLSGTGCQRLGRLFTGDDEMVFPGTIEQQEVRVGSKNGGRIAAVMVREGERVEAGEELVRFETVELMALLEQARARVAQQEARLARLERGARPEERAQARAVTAAALAALEAVQNWPRGEETAQARAAMAGAEAERGNARTTFERVRRLRETGDLAQQELDAARYRLDQATARVEAEKQRLALLLNGSRDEERRMAEERHRQAEAAERLVVAGPRREEIDDARAQLAEARARVEQLGIQLAEGVVSAPTRARVEVLPVRPGDLLIPNQVVARLLEDDRIWVRIYIPEPRLGLVRVGQPAEIRVDSFPDRIFTGSIEQINGQGEFTPRNIQSRDERNHLVFGIKVRIDDRDGTLKSGMAAEVRIVPGTTVRPQPAGKEE